MAARVILVGSTSSPHQPSSLLASIQQAPSLCILFLGLALEPSAPPDALSHLHRAQGHCHIPSQNPDANHNGGEREEGEKDQLASGRAGPAPSELQCAQIRRDSDGPAGPRTERGLAARGGAESRCRALRGTGRPLDRSPGLARGRRAGQGSPPRARLLTADPAPWPAAPLPRFAQPPPQARPQPEVCPAGAAPFAGAAAPPPTSSQPPHLRLLTSAALRTDGRAGRVRRRRGAQGRGRPGTDAPQREQRPPGAAGRRSATPSRGRPTLHRGLAGGRGAAVDAAKEQREARTRAVSSPDHCRLTTPRRSSPNSARSRRRGTPPRARAPRVTPARPATETDAEGDQSR